MKKHTIQERDKKATYVTQPVIILLKQTRVRKEKTHIYLMEFN
jgi:hypothetical protein